MKVLKEYITQGAHKLAIAKPPQAVTNIVSWRPDGIKYKKNEVRVTGNRGTGKRWGGTISSLARDPSAAPQSMSRPTARPLCVRGTWYACCCGRCRCSWMSSRS